MDYDIMDAIHKNDIEFVKKYIKDGHELEPKHCDGDWTPLTKACDLGHVEIVKLLIDAGCQINHSCSKPVFCIPMQMAAQSSYECTKLLIEAGCKDLNIILIDDPPIVAAACMVYDPMDFGEIDANCFFAEYINYLNIIKLLIESGCDLNIRGFYGQDYKYFLCESRHYEKNKKKVEDELEKSMMIRYSKSSLLKRCAHIIRNRRETYENQLHFLNRDLQKLIY